MGGYNHTAGVVLSSSVCVANSISHTQLGMPTQCRISHEGHTLSVVYIGTASSNIELVAVYHFPVVHS